MNYRDIQTIQLLTFVWLYVQNKKGGDKNEL